jgi:hypothetical protein
MFNKPTSASVLHGKNILVGPLNLKERPLLKNAMSCKTVISNFEIFHSINISQRSFKGWTGFVEYPSTT